MQKIANLITTFNRLIGRSCAWLVVLMTLITVAIIVARWLWGQGSIAAQEGVMYMHAALFLLTMAYTLNENGHVRVDIFYRRFKPLQQAWVNAIGSIVFLFPFASFICVVSWGFVLRSWGFHEASANPGGLAFVYLLKALIPLCGLMLVLQSFSQVVNSLSTLTSVLNEDKTQC